ncbi:molybdate ABC transporter substrate-binding protein [Aliiroseovarius crassostreae]|uniref:molybdate ABC transporter substrate-binding protein n=1 Tax=Aliiroseovarius crassostreae TaxID=154981 RepID=UPI0021AFF0D4|nr:molybdate ABC transporter substrate-binding protein [Aliiroseovarius crassostreae]UWQ06578.1 molybdate ABC transporter substrate-binding protein [Aliiroseovarius crassostreae]
MFLRLFKSLMALALPVCFAVPSAAGQVTIFAAASLKTALEDLAPVLENATGHELTLSFAGTSALARQIEYGAPTDIFISANPDWMDYLDAKGLTQPTSRTDLVGNRLVLVGQGGAADLNNSFDFGARLRGGRLAMALVDAVPAGIYGKAALQSLGQWEALRPRVAQADNVRAALALVAQGAAPLGIVYESDANAEPRTPVIGVFPADTHPPIRYPAALTVGAVSEAGEVLDWLMGPVAQDSFRSHGFQVPGQGMQ